MLISSSSQSRLDQIGSCGSSLCAIHCLVSILAPGFLTAVGLSYLMSEGAEWILTGLAVLVGLVAAVMGYRRNRSIWIMAAFVFFISGLLLARSLEELGVSGDLGGVIAIFGGIGLAITHLINLRTNRAKVPGKASCGHEQPA